MSSLGSWSSSLFLRYSSIVFLRPRVMGRSIHSTTSLPLAQALSRPALKRSSSFFSARSRICWALPL